MFLLQLPGGISTDSSDPPPKIGNSVRSFTEFVSERHPSGPTCPESGPSGAPPARVALRRELNCFAKNRRRVRHFELGAGKLAIGSGPVEVASKTLAARA